MIDTLEELAIILKDRKPLDGHDRAVISQAMEELTAMERQLLAMQRALEDVKRERIMLKQAVQTLVVWPRVNYAPIQWGI